MEFDKTGFITLAKIDDVVVGINDYMSSTAFIDQTLSSVSRIEARGKWPAKDFVLISPELMLRKIKFMKEEE